MIRFSSFTGSEEDAAKLHYLLSENPEPVICKVFGCGRKLTAQEKLFGLVCIHHSGKGALVSDGRCAMCEIKLVNARRYLYGKT